MAQKNGRRFLWVGGSGRAGKSTMTTRIGKEFGYVCYDGTGNAHRRLPDAKPGSAAHAYRIAIQNQDPQSQFLEGTPESISNQYMAWAREDFDLARQEIDAYSNDTGVIVDAFLLPPAIALSSVNPNDVVFLFSTPQFQRTMWEKTTWYLEYTKRCRDPNQAKENFIAGALRTSQMLLSQCQRLGGRIIITGGRLSADEVYYALIQALGLSS